MRRWLALALGLPLLQGCATVSGWFSGEKVSEPPAPLAEFQPETRVQTVWSRDAGSAGGELVLALRPGLRGGQLAVADPRGRVSLLDADTGAPVWEADLRLPASAGPTLGDGVVVVGASDGQVVALEAEGGAVRWETRLSSEVLAPPAIARGVAVVRSVDGRVYGLDARSGRRIWVFERAAPVLTLRGTAAPVVAGDLVLLGFDGGRLVAVTLQDGRAVWEVGLGSPRGRSDIERIVDVDAAPVVAADAVYAVAYHGRLAALDLASGRPHWDREMSSTSGLAVSGRTVYVSDEQGYVWGLDRFSGQDQWQQTGLRGRGLTGPVVVGRYVVVGDREGYLHWLRREDGAFAGRERVDREGFYPGLETDGTTLYVYGRGATVAALRPGG
jgi:outer membrane protein assembly factor BamB